MPLAGTMSGVFFTFQFSKKMTSTEIFIEFEKMAIEWGKKYQIAKVGEIVISKLGGKRERKLILSSVSVTIGRNAKKTTNQTLVIQYAGRRMNANGEIIDEIGTGRCLYEFRTEDGRVFSHEENEVTEFANNSGLTFCIDFDPLCKEKYPNAYSSYQEPYHDFSYSR